MAVQETKRLAETPTNLARYVVKFAAYNILAPSVLLTIAAGIMAYINFFETGDKSSPIARLAEIFPEAAEQSIVLSGSDMLNIFFYVSLVFALLFTLIRYIVLRFWKKEIKLTSLQRFLIGEAVILSIFLLASASVPFAKMAVEADRSMFYVILAIFGVIAMFLYMLYFGINLIADRIKIYHKPASQ